MTLPIMQNTNRENDFVADEMVKKLILLFILEKMEFPLTDATLSEIVIANPSWMTYMDCKDALYLLGESRFVHRLSHGADIAFSITQDGRMCLSSFFAKIPASIREEITDFAKDNRQRFRRSQDYTHDYFKNSDGTYTIILRIKDGNAVDQLLELRLKVPTRAAAVRAVAKWKEKAPVVYESLHTTMLDDM